MVAAIRSGRGRAPRMLIVLALLASLVFFDACSSSGTAARKQTAAARATPNLVRWRQCLVRHGAKLTARKAVKAKFTRAQLVRALRKNKTLRLKFAAALVKAPPGVEVTRYKRAAQACIKPGALAAR